MGCLAILEGFTAGANGQTVVWAIFDVTSDLKCVEDRRDHLHMYDERHVSQAPHERAKYLADPHAHSRRWPKRIRHLSCILKNAAWNGDCGVERVKCDSRPTFRPTKIYHEGCLERYY